MMKKITKKYKGFTLVELLAVIVILAIIALIATPIILNIIEGARKDAAKASAIGYVRAVNLKIMDGELTEKPIEDNEYDISDLEVTVSGKTPDEGTIIIEGKEVVEYTLRFGEYTVTKTRDGSITVTKGKVEMITFTIEGQEFTVAKGTLLKDVSGLEKVKIKDGFVFKNFKIEDEVIDENKYKIESTVEIIIEWDKNAKTTITELVSKESATKTSGDGTIENLGKYGIRYRGKDPENYVSFNEETWRIIGIVDGYMKIISEPLKDSSGSELELSWDNKDTTTGAESNSGKNEWVDARLMKLLNPNYDEETYGGSLYWNSGKGKCYRGTNNATIDCDFTNTGLKKETQDMIAEVTWKLGGWNTSEIIREEMYEKERGTEVYEGRKTEWTGKVGLMYPSDYGFASPKECTSNLYNYNTSGCFNKNWLFKQKFYWTLSPHSFGSISVFRVSALGPVYNADNTVSSYDKVRAVVHLKPEVKIIDGDGSKENPYKLSYTQAQ